MAQITNQSGDDIVAAAGASGNLFTAGSGTLLGFLCTVTGTLNLYDGADNTGNPVVVALPVTAGQYTPIPARFLTKGFYALTTAAGTFFVGY